MSEVFGDFKNEISYSNGEESAEKCSVGKFSEPFPLSPSLPCTEFYPPPVQEAPQFPPNFPQVFLASRSRKGGSSKGAECTKQTFLQGNGLPSAAVTRHPSALESQSRANRGSVVANPICKCRCHKAGHLQVQISQGRSLASASGSGQAIDLCFEGSLFK